MYFIFKNETNKDLCKTTTNDIIYTGEKWYDLEINQDFSISYLKECKRAIYSYIRCLLMYRIFLNV